MKLHLSRELLVLKLAYFLSYCFFFTPIPYVTLIGIDVASYDQLGIMFAFITTGCIFGPVIVGYVADKTAAYKTILIASFIVGIAVLTSIVALQPTRISEVARGESNASVAARLIWNGTDLQLHTSDDHTFDSSATNLSVWLDVDSCLLANQQAVHQDLLDSLTRVEIGKRNSDDDNNWQVLSGAPFELSDSPTFECSVTLQNATWTSVVVRKIVPAYAFPVLTVLRVTNFVVVDTQRIIMDMANMFMSKKYGGDFGRQKMWGAFGSTVAPFICGFVMDYAATNGGHQNYYPAFVLCGSFGVATLPLLFNLDIQMVKSKQSVWKAARKVSKMADMHFFLAAIAILGLSLGFHNNHVAIYMIREQNSSKALIGITLAVDGLAGTVGQAFGTPIVNKLGPVHTLIAGLLTHSARLITLSFLRTAWGVLLVDCFDWSVMHLVFQAGQLYCADAAPAGMQASLTGIMSACMYGIGRGMGATLGSVLVSKFGLRNIYLAFGITHGASAIVYFVVYRLWLRKLEEKRLAAKKSLEAATGVENPAVVVEDAEIATKEEKLQQKSQETPTLNQKETVSTQL